jgi:AraC-like DNA-binding protein
MHPLISVIHVEDIQITDGLHFEAFSLNFYSISLKRDVQAKMKYGQQYYDFDKGVMSFTAPKQLQSHDLPDGDSSNQEIGKGYVLLFHPDFLIKHPLSAKIKTYGFFSYAIHEALHLSGKEEANILEIIQKTEQECQHIDRHTQEIILSQIDLLLNYSNRFYERQFITRKAVNNDLLVNMEQLLENYFSSQEPLNNGLPTVDYLANRLNVSAHYLSDMLRLLTGQNTQQHIHEKLIEKAKEHLTLTDSSVAEIAYLLGFTYAQSFNKLFKKRTNVSPLEFRKLFM